MQTFITAGAEADFEAIGDYVARDNPVWTLSFVRELYERGLDIADIPASQAGRATTPVAPKPAPLPGSDTPAWPRI